MSEPSTFADLDSHLRYVDAQLTATRARVAEAVELVRTSASRDAEAAWLATCAQREVATERGVSATHWPMSRLMLSETELRVLWVLIAHELCPSTRAQLRTLATENEADVSFDVLRRVVYGSVPEPRAWHELSAAGSLQRRCLIDPIGATDIPTHRMTFRVARRVMALVHGQVGIDHELANVLAEHREARGVDELAVDDRARARVRTSVESGTPLTIVYGLVGSGRRSLIAATATAHGDRVIAIDARKLSSKREIAERQLRMTARECCLLRCLPLVQNLEALAAHGEIPDRLDLIESCFTGPVFATAAQLVQRPWRRPTTQVELPPLSGATRERMWQRALPEATTADAVLLATVYPLAPALIDSVGRVALTEAGGARLDAKHVAIGIRTVLDDRLAGLATRVTVSQTWNDLVLPEDQTIAIVELLARIRARRRVYEDWGFAEKLGKGLGVAALFSGPPGTGKTMCAGLVAKDLGTELYQVDLGKIVSKWIGETEKNLAALFDAAEAGHAVLLFDEADSLFGKRTSVTSSNDRYANQEINFLLQRLETFAGICILTTNHEPAIDEAFRRRLAVHVRFPVPDDEEREKLWRALLPAKAPVDTDLELAALAKKYVMGGGNIRNAVLRAAFLAADANEPIGNYHLRNAAQLEYEGMGKIAVARDR